MIVWLIPLGIVVAVAGVVGLVKVVQQHEDERIADTVNWTDAEATIQEGRLEQFDRQHEYPCLAFSYVASGEYYSGEFWLQAEGDQAEGIVKELLGSKFAISYDPKSPSSWYIPQESMESYRIVFREL